VDNVEHSNGVVQLNIVFLVIWYITGRWRFWPNFIVACIRISLEGLGRTNCGGSLRGKEFSR
jgi:hypothetical protein